MNYDDNSVFANPIIYYDYICHIICFIIYYLRKYIRYAYIQKLYIIHIYN